MKITRKQLIILIESFLNEEGTDAPKGEAPKRPKLKKIKKRPARGVTKQIPPGFLENPEERARFAKGFSKEIDIFTPNPELVKDYAGRYAGTEQDKANPVSHLAFGPEPDDFIKRGKRPYRLEDIPDDPKHREAWEEAQSYNIGDGERTAQDPELTMTGLPDEASADVKHQIKTQEASEDMARIISLFLDDFMEEKGLTDEDTIPIAEFKQYVESQGYSFPTRTLQKEVKRILNRKKLWKYY